MIKLNPELSRYLDSDVAELYGVETREVNQAVRRNSRTFPDDYLIELTADEWIKLKSQIVISKKA